MTDLLNGPWRAHLTSSLGMGDSWETIQTEHEHYVNHRDRKKKRREDRFRTDPK